MLVKDYKKYLNLSRLLNTTFGISSLNKKVATQSIKFDIIDEGMLKCRFITIINFNNNIALSETMRRSKDEALTMLRATLEKLKENYKKNFPKEDNLSFKLIQDSIEDNVEFITFSPYNGSKKGYYRFECLIKVK